MSNALPYTTHIKTKRFGQITPAVVAPKLGPRGIAPKKAKEQIEETFGPCAGPHKLFIKVTVDTNRNLTLESSLHLPHTIIRSINNTFIDQETLKEEHGMYRGLNVGRYEKGPMIMTHDGTISLETVKKIAREQYRTGKTNAKSMTATVMQVLGTCVSVGCKVNSMDPRILQSQIRDGLLVVEDYLDDELYERSK
jgi:large subunit ribosomal protein L12e